MSRIDRRKWTYKEVGYKNKGGFLDLVDNMIKISYRINDEEFDLMAENMTEEEGLLFMEDNPTFGQKRLKINLLNKYIRYE